MVLEDWKLLSRLKRAVKKVRYVLNFNIISKWRLASMVGSSSSQRRLSFNNNNNQSGLLSFIEDRRHHQHGIDQMGLNSPSLRREISRTTSILSTDDQDIDDKAEMFINNFYKQLQMERQVSLELRYCRENSLESNLSD
ncbi:uncharacterized protein LOC113329089 [Papaver somniferum]|uniref:uncharacterized protein LOC113329089 n=1 Tax=Papaver somniferum TaxID=3469 RepID=UPI000E7022EC|nr:uncharacterized protein LOC113329089 [Papaver somniferum]